MKIQFEDWYPQQITTQIDGKEDDLADLEPVNLCLTMLKKLQAKWFITMSDYFANNLEIVINGFVQAGNSGAFDDVFTEQQEEAGSETEGNFSASDNEGWSDGENDTSTVI